jgi:hypothetical protein
MHHMRCGLRSKPRIVGFVEGLTGFAKSPLEIPVRSTT